MTTLTAGDIAIIGMNADRPDKVSFVLLTDIEANTEIKLTDNGVKADGSFRANEGVLTWTAAQNIAAGTVIAIDSADTSTPSTNAALGSVAVTDAGFNLSGGGDQVIAYQGDDSAPTFIAAVNAEGNSWQSDATNSNTSALPTGLTNGVNAVAVSEADNIAYTANVTSGSQAAILAAVNNAQNWTGSNSTSTAPAHRSDSFSLKNFKTNLDAGDIAIVGLNADGDDKVSFVLLTDIAQGAEIHFTDNGVKADGSFRANEGILTWTAAQNIAAGAVITIENANTQPVTNAALGSVVVTDAGFNLSGSGDQVIAYQGTESTPRFIYAVNSQNDAWQTEAMNSNTSALPMGLTDGVNAVALNEVDNAAYTGVMSGNAQDILAAISNPNNWTGSNRLDTAPVHPTNFVIDGSSGNTGDDKTAPTLISSNPVDESVGFAANTDITLTFDEAVVAGSGVFTLKDGTGAVVETFDVTGNQVTFAGEKVIINPSANLTVDTVYRIEADATAVQDSAGNAWIPDFGEVTPETLNFTASAPNYTRISTIQGEGDNGSAAYVGKTVTIEAVVTAYVPGKNGFYVQEQATDYDANVNTSEGIFVYYGSQSSNPGVTQASIGDTVTLQGTVSEFRGNTQIRYTQNFTVEKDGTVADLPEAVTIQLPVVTSLEAYENMRVTVESATENGSLVVTDNYNLGRYGQVTLTSDEIQTQFTETNAPNQAGYAAFLKSTKADQIILDDGLGSQNPENVWGRNGEPLSATNTLRAGDSIQSVSGVLEEFVDNRAGAHETSFRIQPTNPESINFTGDARPTAEQLQSQLGTAEIKVASVNVLNYFTTEGRDSFTTPFGNTQPGRGASNAQEFQRQQDKLVDMLTGLDADVVGLMEIQNNGFGEDSALKALVDALNAKAGEGTYDYIKGPFTDGTSNQVAAAGQDAITVGFIYKPANVTPVGQAAVPDTDTYDAFTATFGNRVPLAQTFQSNKDGETFTAVVNHFKSKGTEKDPDQLDGQGRNQEARERASEQLVDWLKTDPTGSNDKDSLLLGDFNAYSKEDAITKIDDNGYDKISSGLSYSFDGLWGSLDHAFASDSLVSQVSGTVKWAINAEEPGVLDYNTEHKSDTQQDSYYAPDAYRSSDHNPILIGLNLGPQIPDDAIKGTERGDFLRGTKDNDSIYGFEGSDFLMGRQGDDTIVAGAGHDWVFGGAGADTIHGGEGTDWLFGGHGNDIFVFDTALNQDNVDTLVDFVSVEDVLHLDSKVFTQLAKGNLAAENFASNAEGKAQDADDYMVYNTSTGTLSYDADGSGVGVAVEVAHVGYFNDLTIQDIVVI